jgi:hypothetical protein
VQVLIGTQEGPLGGHVLIFVAELVFAVIFWTFSPYLLLLGKVTWRALLPTGLATGFCLTGLSVFSALLFSSSVVSGEQQYGPVGVVTALLSYLIGFRRVHPSRCRLSETQLEGSKGEAVRSERAGPGGRRGLRGVPRGFGGPLGERVGTDIYLLPPMRAGPV